MLKHPPLLCALLIVTPPAQAHAAGQRGDFWLDATLHFRLADGPLAKTTARPDPAVSSDYANKNAGDCSVAIKYTAAKLYKEPVILITPNPCIPAWNLGKDWTLQFDLSQTNGTPAPRCTIILADASGKLAQSAPIALTAAKDAWQQVKQPFNTLTHPANFDFTKITRATLRLEDGQPATVRLDAVRFTTAAGAGKEIALTDQLTTQRMADERATRHARIAEAMEIAACTDQGKSDQFYHGLTSTDMPATILQRLFANLYLSRELEQTNRELHAILTTTDPKVRASLGFEYAWHLAATPTLCRLYFNFSAKSTRFPGRLTPAVEKALLDLLWERTQYKNAIQAARESTWNMTGSENHDINAKVSNVLTSQIFMHEPAYASRIYPNLGTGMGYGYWFHGAPDTGRYHGPEGTAPRDYPGDLRPADHYKAWTGFMKEYIRERAKRGFFLEKASTGYMRHTISFLQDLHDYTADPELKQLAGMFLDLIWAEWAQDQLAGARGGAKTRDSKPILNYQADAMYQMASYLFGGPPRNSLPLLSFWLTDHRPPAMVWNLAMNRAALGSYAYVSRTPGEEPPVTPRPAGMERTLLLDTDSHLLRYSWVTPDYILGTQMDHPLATHSHLSVTARSHGMAFSTNPGALVQPRDLAQDKNGAWQIGRGSMYRSLQHGPVMITQQSRWYAAVSPEWFPNQSRDSRPYGVYFAPELAHIEEDSGWIFVEEGNAYLAVRVVQGAYQISIDAESDPMEWTRYKADDTLTEPLAPAAFTWLAPRTLLRSNDRHSPIIFEAARRADYPTLADFKRHILANPIVLSKLAVPGWYALTYTSNNVEYYFNAASSEIPRINNVPIDYAPARVFDSPCMQAEYRHGIVRLNDGTNTLILDFTKAQRHEK